MMREEWVEVNYETVVKKVTLTNKKIKQKEYLNNGNIPVIDQGQELIGGYTNDETKILDCKLPALVFGDHTKIVKLINFPFASGADGTKVLEPKLHFEPKLLKYFTEVLTLKIKDKGYARHYQDIEKSQIPLPPSLEQKAIVAKVEQLFSELDNGIENLKIAQAKLKIYRQAVLKKAFEGEFTREWREKQIDLPTAEELLEIIKQEREVHYQQQLQDWKDGKSQSKPKKVKFQNDLKTEDIGLLPIIPSQWSWLKWEQILDYGSESFKRGPFGSALTKSIFVKSGYKVYEQYCPINDDCSYERYYITDDKFEELKHFAVKANDFLISCSGVTLGRITQVPEEFKEGVINQALLRVRINEKFFSHKLFKILFRSHYFQRKIFDNSTGSAIPNVKGVSELKAIPLPLLSIQEQNQIVLEIELRLSVCDKIEETIRNSLTKAEALRQSILKKAFEGNLLNAQELEAIHKHPDYESSENLLKRIKQERAK
jgi:type I restriction enzyme S subunit